MIYLTSTNETSIINAEQKITENCGFPFEDTDKWADVTKAYNQNLWFIKKPTGYNYSTLSLSESEMMDGVDLTNITEEELDLNWFDNSEE